MSLNTYLTLIDQQRVNNPNFQKDYRTSPLARKTRTAVLEWADVQRYTNAKVSCIVQRDLPLFPDANEEYYYEIVDTSPAYRSTFPDWKFWYLPISYADDLIAAGMLNSLTYYDAELGTTGVIYPRDLYLFNITRPSSFYLTIPLTNNTHPYSPNFIFTGHSFPNKNGCIIYEYQDFKMFTDHISINYYSQVPPANFAFPIDGVDIYGVRRNINFSSFVGLPPVRQTFVGNTIPDYRYTGQTTNAKFTQEKEWYIYRRFINNQPENLYLLPDPPTALDITYAYVAIEGTQMGLNFPSMYNTQSVSINQTSSNNKIVIAP